MDYGSLACQSHHQNIHYGANHSLCKGIACRSTHLGSSLTLPFVSNKCPTPTISSVERCWLPSWEITLCNYNSTSISTTTLMPNQIVSSHYCLKPIAIRPNWSLLPFRTYFNYHSIKEKVTLFTLYKLVSPPLSLHFSSIKHSWHFLLQYNTITYPLRSIFDEVM